MTRDASCRRDEPHGARTTRAGVRCSARLTLPSAARTHPGKELGAWRRRCDTGIGPAGSLADPTLVPRARSVSLAATARVHPTGGTPPGVTPLERLPLSERLWPRPAL